MTPLDHFIRLGRARHRGASSGEVRARRLALAIIDAAGVLDGAAFDGALEFAACARQSPEQARNIVDGWDATLTVTESP